MPNRCATRSYLRLVSREREWNGTPSTTQLIRGTISAWLQITRDYAVSPGDRAFMILGSRGHAKLQGSDDEYSTLEGYLDGPDITGIYDVLEEEDGRVVLVDYKTSGSYKVSKALGFHVVEEETGEVYKSGKRKGQPKTRKILHRDDEFMDRRDWELQLNMYRIQLERRGIHIDEMRVMCIVRDGNTWIARSRGVFRNIYYFRIARLDDAEVLAYFERKRQALFSAIEEDKCDLVCNAHENWQGIRCTRYCEVAEFCPLGKYLKIQKEADDMPIKGLSDARRIPRIGKIALGIKKQTMKAGKMVEYPSEVNYFVLRPQTPDPAENERLIAKFEDLYGKEPRSIAIMVPLSDREMVFPHYYKRYGSSTLLQCKGDGETASCLKEHAAGLEVIEERNGRVVVKCLGQECPYYTGDSAVSKTKKCSEVATLQVLLPEMPGAGVWQITTSSKNSIMNINGSLDFLEAIVGRINMLPLKLERVQQEMQHDGKKRIHYPLKLNANLVLAELQGWAQIDATKVLLELPEVAESKEDLIYEQTPEDAIYTEKPSEPIHEGGGPEILDDEPSVAEGKAYAHEMADAVVKSIAKEFDREEALAQVEAETQKPESSRTSNGWTYTDAVRFFATTFEVDIVDFGLFCDATYKTEGKALLVLKPAMGDGKEANKLQKAYDKWYETHLAAMQESEGEQDVDEPLLI